MIRNNSGWFASLKKPLASALALWFAIWVFWLITKNEAPNVLRPLSMLLRTGYTAVVPVLFIVFYLVFRLKGWLGSLLSLFLTLSVFALALAGVWAAGTMESGLLGGVIPMFNSANYYHDAIRLLAGFEFSEDSTRRPFFTAFLAFLLWVTRQDLIYALSILTLLVALACWLLAREIHRTHGAAIAAFVLVIVFVYYRFHSGVVRTENLGILFGALGTAMIWRSLSKQHPLYFIGGVFLTSIGMIARAGAFFVLPLLVLWGAAMFKKPGKIISWQFLTGGLIAVFTAFLINQAMVKSFGAGDILPFGNFAYSFYGLASGGKSWAHILTVNPQAGYLEIYKMAAQLILEQPGLFLQGVYYNYSMFLSNTGYGLYSYMGGEGQISSTISYWALMGLSLLGIWTWFHRRHDPYLGFIMVTALGLILSVPFLPPTDAFRMRAYATSIVTLALLPSMGLHFILTKLKLERLNPQGEGVALDLFTAFSALVTVAVIFVPFALKGIDLPPQTRNSKCAPGLVSLHVRYEPATRVESVPQNTVLLDRTPVFHIGTLRRNIHDFPSVDFMHWFLEHIAPSKTLFFSLDYPTSKSALVLAETDSLPAFPSLVEVCGTWEDNPDLAHFNIFYAKAIHPIFFE